MAAPQHPCSILIVDDDAATSKLLQSILEIRYPEALLSTAADGRAGLESFTELRQDIVITDLTMPRMNGVQMARKIRELQADVKLIALTGNSRDDFPDDAPEKRFSFDHYITKPITLEAVFTAIAQCLGQRS